MKKLVLVLLVMLFTSIGNAQFTVSALQDARLALVGDDKGNEAFTSNFIFNATQVISGNKYLNVVAFGEYEFGDLRGGYFKRLGGGFGLNFDNWINNFEFQATLGVNRITRNNNNFSAWSLNGDVIYNITNNVSVIMKLQQLNRTDLKNQPFIYSGFVGVRFKIFNKPLFDD